jgi:Zn-dependent oligopeptidase
MDIRLVTTVIFGQTYLQRMLSERLWKVKDRTTERLRKNIFSVGNTVDPAAAYRAFRGRDPKVDALMKKRGFVTKS